MTRIRLSSVIEVVIVFILLRLTVWVWCTTDLARREEELLSWGYFSHVLFIGVPILIVLLNRRNWASYGLSLATGWRSSLKWGAIFAASLGLPTLIALFCGWLIIDWPEKWLATFVFQFFFAGFGEEILYRGYYQSRLNQGFGRPYTANQIRFGVGLIAISILFGCAHVMNPFNPLQGSFALDWFAGLVALQTGVFYGLVREKTGSVLASAIIHGSTFWWNFIGDGSERLIGMSIGWSISWIILYITFSKANI